jgi:hypothetical protein
MAGKVSPEKLTVRNSGAEGVNNVTLIDNYVILARRDYLIFAQGKSHHNHHSFVTNQKLKS